MISNQDFYDAIGWHAVPEIGSPENLRATNLASYCRSAVAGNGGIDAQLARIARFCQQGGLLEPASFIDDGVSGNSAIRPGLEMLLRYCSENPGTAVLVAGTERLARSMDAYLKISARLHKVGARVVRIC